jgi:hypothetical protein
MQLVSKIIALFTLLALGLFFLAGESRAQNIAVNGDFEGTTYTEFGDTLPTGWSLSPTDNVSLSNCDVSNVVNSAIDLGPESGTHYMSFQSHETDGSQDCLSQELPTVAGKKYLITFSVAITGGTIGLNTSEYLDPEWDQGGANDTFLRNNFYYPPNSTTDTTVGPASYETFSFTETASSSATTFFFHGVDADGGSILVDNLSVEAVPEPSIWALMLSGGVLLIFFRLRARRA